MSNTSSKADHPVLVVGAGPVGLSAALGLRSHGVAVTVLEAGPEGRPRPGSRAIFLHRQTIERLEQAFPGLGWEVVAHGVEWRTKRTFWGDRQVYARSYSAPPQGVLPHSTNISQRDTEALMFDACKRVGVEFAWDAEVTAVETTPTGVTLTTTNGATWQAQYVIGADGSRSGTRKGLGIEMSGSRSEHSYIVVDVAEDPDQPLPLERLFYYQHPAVGGRNVMMVPFAGGWRADLQCHDDDDPEEWSDEAGVQGWIAKVMPERYAERTTWVSSYQFLQLVADAFTDEHRRVLLAGEASHLFAPFGARGLNSGVPDALAAAKAVALALGATNPAAADGAVDEFAAIRRGAALHNRQAASIALKYLRASDLRTRLLQRGAAELARVWEPAGKWLDQAPYATSVGPATQTGIY